MSTELKFREAVTALLMTQPFFGQLLLKLKHIENPNLVPRTMGVSKTELHYHPELIENLDRDELMFILGHEVLHKAWDQIERATHYVESKIGPDGKPLDFRLFNCAMDFVVNDALKEQGVGKIPSIGGCFDPRFPHTMTPEEVYCILKKEQEEAKAKGKPDPSAGMDSMDDHMTDGDPTEADPITPADVIQAAENHKALTGKYPAGVDRLIGALKKPSNSPWKRLRQFVVKSLPGFDTTSWRRLQRRPLVRGIGMPGKVAVGAGTVGVVVDTSGSIGQEMLNLFASHMASIIDEARPEKLQVYWVDAKVHRTDTVKNGSQLRALLSRPVPGGGGTNMPKGVDAAIADKCDSVVVLTDGETPFGSRSNRPVLWAITGHRITAPHGVTIHI